ncbi:BAHD acyltransferase [Pyrus ussuriensis x Pyrus communis]|uniref:BAHD acyltransferase n=1 Tax=Pyrus ussuriensis x Pyrus communis TaxID=2448454 RepID=A0A5N5EY22_9ROSA|nr:BAHD acyltransferase [Pyrus ussuriensis x Pyrus communis]
MNTRDGDGIELSLNLKEEDLAIVESNKELLEYASLNPTGDNVPPSFNSFEYTGLPSEIQRCDAVLPSL